MGCKTSVKEGHCPQFIVEVNLWTMYSFFCSYAVLMQTAVVILGIYIYLNSCKGCPGNFVDSKFDYFNNSQNMF